MGTSKMKAGGFCGSKNLENDGLKSMKMLSLLRTYHAF